jgi:hypothetical protein
LSFTIKAKTQSVKRVAAFNRCVLSPPLRKGESPDFPRRLSFKKDEALPSGPLLFVTYMPQIVKKKKK